MTSPETRTGLGEPEILRHRTAQEAVVDMLRELILSGEIQPGTRLLQAEVARRFSISTTPVREALRQLTAEGLLDGDPHRGVTVHTPTLAELEQIYEIRVCLEQLSIRRSVETIDAARIDQAEELAHRMQAEKDLARWVPLNVEFHRLLTATNRPRLTQLLDNLRNISAVYIAASVSERSDRDDADIEHLQLVAALRDRDVELAQELVRNHLEHTLNIARRTLNLENGG